MIKASCYLLLGIWGLVGWTTVSMPIQPSSLQHIQLRDRMLILNLTDFIHRSNANFIAISVAIDPADQGYVYHIHPITYYETIQDYKGPFWGEWHHSMLLFYSRTDLRSVCSVSDTTNRIYLQRYGALLLPRATTRVPGTKLWHTYAQADGGLAYDFKLVKGKEVYFYDNAGYDSRQELDRLPPVPESK